MDSSRASNASPLGQPAVLQPTAQRSSPQASPSLWPAASHHRKASMASRSPRSVSPARFTRKQSFSMAEVADAYERESEAITNNLIKRLDVLRRDKIRIESELEAENESIVNRLSREIYELRTRLSRLEMPNSAISDAASPTLSATATTGSGGALLTSATSTPDERRARRGSRLEQLGSPNAFQLPPSTSSPATSAAGAAGSSSEQDMAAVERENEYLRQKLRELSDKYARKQIENQQLAEEVQSARAELQQLSSANARSRSLRDGD